MFQKSSIWFFFFFGLGHTEIHTKVKILYGQYVGIRTIWPTKSWPEQELQNNVLGERVSKICRF
jgi:hypothetical protein